MHYIRVHGWASLECRVHYLIHLIREKGVEKEDLAGYNIFLVVALGLCAAVAPTCYTDSSSPFKDLAKGLGWGIL